MIKMSIASTFFKYFVSKDHTMVDLIKLFLVMLIMWIVSYQMVFIETPRIKD